MLKASRRHCLLHGPILRTVLVEDGSCSTPLGVTAFCTAPFRITCPHWTSPRMVDTQLSVYNHPGRSIMARKRRTYTSEFKAEAVKLVTEQGYSVAEAARSLGVHETLLRSWKQALDAQGDQAFPGHGKLPPFEEELRRLRAENQRLRAERDILKKATALFALEAL